MKKCIMTAMSILIMVGCGEESPQNLAPTVEVTAATDVTRTSVTLNGKVTPHGGSITRVQFRYGQTPDMPLIAAISPHVGNVSTTVDGLRYNTTHFFCLEAGDDYTLITSEPLTFKTEPRSDTGALWVEKPGTLELLFTEDEAYNTDTLLLSGKLNGDDLRFLRRMLGRDIEGMATHGKVNVLDLFDAQIIEGGMAYDGMHFTQTAVIGKGLFTDCIKLKDIKLPSTTKTIEAEAFKGCTALLALHLPGTITHIEPSTGCNSLQMIDISGNNALYQTDNGVLMNKELTTLIWYPQGLTNDYSTPNSVIQIGDNAFYGSLCRHITLGEKIKEIGTGAFAFSQIVTLTIPDNVENLRNGLFQGCTKLSSLTLGKETLFLSDYLFEGCPLTELHIKSTDFIPHCETNTFTNAEQLFKSCTLYVPKGNKKRYQNDRSWGRFELVVEE